MNEISGASQSPFDSFRVDESPETKRNDELDQSDFLKLMTTQLMHQDPFAPMESAEFLGQLAQFGTVNGITELQTAFTGLAGSMVSNQALQAADLVGHEVLVPGSSAVFNGNQPLRGVVELDAAATNVVVQITDSAGQLIKQMELGSHPPGPVDFLWDGKLKNGDQAETGTYQIYAVAISQNKSAALPIATVAQVKSVQLGSLGQALKLELEGLGPRSMSEIRQIY